MKTVIIVLNLILLPNLYAQDFQEKKYYFYKPEINYGSEAIFNPFTLVINGSFDIFRNGGHNKDISNMGYFTSGTRHVLRAITNPIEIIEKFGWKYFLSQEVFPMSLNADLAQYFPNYASHTIGNGMQYLKMAEWFDFHKVPYPYLFSGITTTIYQFINEVIESGGTKSMRVDPIADMLIFNPLGFLLFSTDFGKKFFSETLPLYDWSLQPVYNFQNHFLENAGQQFVVKYMIPRSKHYSAFFYWGIHGILGISYNYKKVHNFSLGIGRVVNKLKERRRNDVIFLTPELDGAIGFFYDKNHSLMTSIILTGPRIYGASMNIYPGYIRIGWFVPGIFISLEEGNKLLFGLTVTLFPLGIVSGKY
ncbi:MAG: hypothetical protein IIB44_13450 [Candidatus Marinimicrobia bacterium]|nr:hypothetical protein [Candidatus Neomarinimicrobiota bacterium]